MENDKWKMGLPHLEEINPDQLPSGPNAREK
jgi:hypothetical protein